MTGGEGHSPDTCPWASEQQNKAILSYIKCEIALKIATTWKIQKLF